MNKAIAEPAGETGRRPWRRKSRNFILNRRMQSYFVLGFIVIVAGGFVLYLLLSYYLIDRHLAGELYRTHLKARGASDVIESVLWWSAAAALLAIISATAILVYYMTHMTESHLHGFVGAVRRAGHSDFAGRITLKKATADLCESFNRAVSSFDKRFGSIKRSCAVLEDAVTRLGAATGGQLHGDAARAALDSIAAERGRIMEEIKRFRI